MPITGGCHCGAIRYQAEGEALTHALPLFERFPPSWGGRRSRRKRP